MKIKLLQVTKDTCFKQKSIISHVLIMKSNLDISVLFVLSKLAYIKMMIAILIVLIRIILIS
jgi:hypothetical protein